MDRIVLLVLAVLAGPAFAQSSGVGGGPIQRVPLDHNVEIDAAHRAAVARMRALGLDRHGPRALPAPTLGFPLRLRPASKAVHAAGISNFVDLDATSALKEFTCGERTYDGHRGIDISPWPFSWTMMDQQEVEIVAAAPGSIASSHDGEYDRQCATGGQTANSVIILQDDGVYALYWHMKKGSVTTKPVGTRVERGEYLGIVGSSGNSTGPHLHFELRTTGGATIDPNAGLCGDSKTSWQHQPEDTHTDILRIATHTVQPNPSPIACGTSAATGYSNKFAPGQRVWLAAYLRDQRSDTPVDFTVLRPDGSTFGTWSSGTPPASSVYSFAYWYVWFDLPTTNAKGQWTAQITLDARTIQHAFVVGAIPRTTKLSSSVTPTRSSARPAKPAKFEVTVRNTGKQAAFGCTLAPDTPIAADWYFEPVTRKSAKQPRSAIFGLAPGAEAVYRLVIQPKRGYKARDIEVPVRVFCANASAPAAKPGVNIVTLTF